MSNTPADRSSLLPEQASQNPTVLLPEASFLLYGEFERVGFDLVITNPAGEKFVVEDYFALQPPPNLMIAGGAGLTPDMVAALMPDQFEGVMFAGPATFGGELEQIGTVRFARGDVEVSDRNGQTRTVGRGDPVYEGDRIETGDRSFIRIRMDDGTRFNLGMNAEATLDDYQYDEGQGVGNFEAMVRVGGFHYKSGGIGDVNPNVKHTTIKTPSAFIGVRGSELEGTVDQSGQTIVVHRSGVLEITDINGENPVELTQPGNTSVVVMDGSPSFSTQPSPQQIQALQDNLPPAPTPEEEAQDEAEDVEDEAADEADTELGEGGEDAEGSDTPEVETEAASESEGEATETETSETSDDGEAGTEDALEPTESEPADEGDTGDDVLSTQPSEPDFSDTTSIESGETDVTGDSEETTTTDGGTSDGTTTTTTTTSAPTETTDDSSTEASEEPEPEPEPELPPDNPPVANPDTVEIEAGATTDLTTLVLSNDDDPDPDQSPGLSSVDPAAAIGAVTLLDGALTYTASGFESLGQGETSTDTFTYQVSSGGLLDSAQVQVTVTGVNDAPVAENDTAATDENSVVTTGSVLDNDSDPDTPDVLTIAAVDTSNTAGLVTDNGDGTFTYDPYGQFDALTQDATATDSFIYTVSDGNGGTATASVTVTITGVNEPPVATPDTLRTDEKTVVTSGNVLDNDTDADGDPLTIQSVDFGATAGTVTDNGDGTFTYDPDDQFDSLVTGETATDSFSYTVSDGSGGTATGTVTVTIDGREPPVAVADSVSIEEGAGLTVDVLANDTDADGDTLAVVAADTVDSIGTVTNNEDGTFSYSPAGQFQSLGVGETATDGFLYTVSDEIDGSDTAAVNVTVNGLNDVPVAAPDTVSTTNVAAVTTGNLLVNDSDVDATDVLTLASVDTTGTLGLVTDNGDGTFTYDPNGQFGSLIRGATTTDSFNYVISDGNGGAATGNVTITIEGANTPPVAVADSAGTDQNTSATVDVVANDSDPDGHTLSVQSVDTSVTTGTVTNNGDGTVTYNPGAQFNFLAAGEAGTDSFAYTVTDGFGGTASANVTVTITGVNDAPVANVDAALSVFVGQTTPLSVLANDSDPDIGDTLNVTASSVSELAGSLFINTGGTIDYTPNPLFEMLEPGETVTDTFDYRVTDPSGASDTATVTVNVGLDPSVLAAGDDFESAAPLTNVTTGDVRANDGGGSGTLTVQSWDPKTSNGSEVVYNGDGTFTVFLRTRAFNFDPGSETVTLQTSPYEEHFEYVLTDGTSTTEAEVTIDVSSLDTGTRTDVTRIDTSQSYTGTTTITGRLLNLGAVTVGSAANLTVTSGIDNAGSVFLDSSSNLTLENGVFYSGVLEGFGSVDVSTAAFVGEHGTSPGGSTGIGTMTLVGNDIGFTAHHNLFIELGSSITDQLSITGSADLDGNVIVDDLAFSPTGSETFDIITASSGYSGEIRNFGLPVFGNFVVEPSQTGSTPVSLSFLSATSGTTPTSATDTLLGTTGPDTFDLTTNASGDRLYGDSGADTFIISDLTFARIDGGGELLRDGDAIEFATANPDLTGVTAYQIDSIDILDLRGTPNTLNLDVDSALNINSQLFIPGDSGDHVVIIDAYDAYIERDPVDATDLGLGQMSGVSIRNAEGDSARLAISPNATVQINEADGDITYIGSANNDSLIGTAADERFGGRAGDDQIQAGGGNDEVFADPNDITLVDGGDGIDVLMPAGEGAGIDLTRADNPYANFEIIALDEGESSNTLEMNLADVAKTGVQNLLYGDGTNQLIIEGSIDDYVILNGRNLREGDPSGLTKTTDPRFPDFVNYTDGTNMVLVDVELLGPGVNHAPVGERDSGSTLNTQTVTLDVLTNDFDPDPGDTLAVSLSSSLTASGATLTLNADNTITYDPTTSASLGAIGPALTVDDVFQYTVTDNNAASTTVDVEVEVEGNHAPEASATIQGLGTVDDTSTFFVDLLATMFDANGDTLTIQGLTPDPSMVTGVSLDPTDSTTLVVDPTVVSTSTLSFTYQVTDGVGGTSSTTADVRVAGPVNHFTNEGIDASFINGNNWSDLNEPTSSDVITIENGFVTLAASDTVDFLNLGEFGEFIIGATSTTTTTWALTTSTTTFTTNQLVMRDDATVELNGEPGSALNVLGDAKLDANAFFMGGGTIQFRGPGATLDLPDGYIVEGPPWVLSGGTDTTTSDFFTITGGLLQINSTGEVRVEDGVNVINNQSFVNDGLLTIAGSGSTLVSPTLHVHGDMVNNGTVRLDTEPSATVSLNATLDVFGGTFVNSGTLISDDSSGLGGTRTIDGDMSNQGTIEVQHSLEVRAEGGFFDNAPSGLITVADSQSLIFVGGQVFNEGTIDATAGINETLDVTGVEFNNEGGVIEGFATINGAINGGTVIAGSSPGTLEINGDLNNSSDSLHVIELAGNDPGTGYDQFIINGTAHLDGRLNVTLLNGFIPALSAGFVILAADTLTGSFASAEGLDISTSRILDLSYVDNQVELATVAVSDAGSTDADLLSGTVSNDVIVSDAGDDAIIAIGQGDIVYGQAGNDTIEAQGDFKRVDGGDGVDTLQLSSTVDLGNQSPVAVDNIEVLSLENNRADTIELDATKIKGMVDGRNELAGMDNALVIVGEAGDMIKLHGDFVAEGEMTLTLDGVDESFRVFTQGDVSLLVSDSLSLEIHRTDGTVDTVELQSDDGVLASGNTIDMSGLDSLQAETTATSDSTTNVALSDLVDDGSNSLDSLLGDSSSGGGQLESCADSTAGYMPAAGDPLGTLMPAEYSSIEV